MIGILSICKYVTSRMGTPFDFKIAVHHDSVSCQINGFPFQTNTHCNLDHHMLDTSFDRQRMGRAVITELRAISVLRAPDVFITERRFIDV